MTLTAEHLANAANLDKALPLPPLPTQPVVTDSFAYSDDEQ
jgi:carboxypeptidase Q